MEKIYDHILILKQSFGNRLPLLFEDIMKKYFWKGEREQTAQECRPMQRYEGNQFAASHFCMSFTSSDLPGLEGRTFLNSSFLKMAARDERDFI